MKRFARYKLTGLLFAGLAVWAVAATHPDPVFVSQTESWLAPPPDTIPEEGPVELIYPIKDFSGNPHLEKEEGGLIDPGLPDNMVYRTEYDPVSNQVTLYRQIGSMDVRLPYTMSLEEYQNADMRKSIIAYWHQRQQMESGRYEGMSGFHPSFKFGGEAFNSIFGSNMIDVKMQGMAELKVGMTTTRIDNPTLQERLRQTTTFNFEENIQMNITGNIGDKLKLGINYNTEALFDFENEVKLEYTGKEDEIIKKVEAGNVSLPLPGTLITGSQSLFGVKTEMQFGKLTVTSILSQQKGESQVVNIQGGGVTQEFDVSIDQYDSKRHFFLSHAFRDNYDNALSNLPFINSPYTINKIEVWVTNKTGNFDNSRNILGFIDLGEFSAISNTQWVSNTGEQQPDNNSNSLYNEVTTTFNGVRNISKVSTVLPSQLHPGNDYDKIENARLLSASEYTVNSELGYISLNTALQADEVLAVAYQYSYRGEMKTVGELSTQGIDAPQTLIVKMLKGTTFSPKINTWDLMMKNIYSIGAYQVNQEDFKLNVVYTNDSTGSDINYFPEGDASLKGQMLIRMLNLDNLNSNLDPSPDGVFDYIDGITINSSNGRIIFPMVEPFGSYLENKLNDTQLSEKYAFHNLYDSTQTVSTQTAEKNKFKLKGSYKSSSSSEISLNAMNIPQGSVVVTAGGIKLVENVDYTVDYNLGKIKIINSGLMQSGSNIQVSLESQSLYATQTKTLIGSHFNYQFNNHFNVGTTIMHLSERPMTQKVNIGDEPISNTIWGMNTSYSTQSQALTNWLDKLPLLVAQKESNITVEGEFAQLIPGHSSVLQDGGTAYIDDFEGAKISYDLKNITAWKLSSVPQGQETLFANAGLNNDLKYGFDRAKLAWYVIDPLFLRNYSETPSHIKSDVDQLSNHFVREVYEGELFPDKETAYGEPTNISMLNFAYYPNERGPYNFDTNLDANGMLLNPQTRFGGIMRKLETNDFEAANIEYIEFWMMDPFVYDNSPGRGGDLYFNLGNISEDIQRDSRKSFEQGLPGPGEIAQVDTTVWGVIPQKQSLVNAFSNEASTRQMQDVGFDGLPSAQEASFFNASVYPFINLINASGTLSADAKAKILADPSADDFHYYRGSDFDANKTTILDRYKNYNNPEGNSVATEYSPETYSTAATSVPDMEDINGDYTLSETESYFQYKFAVYPDSMVVGKNYITNMVERSKELKNGKTETVKWYQVRIPLSDYERVGEISDFTSIRFMRMFMHNALDTMILRFATLDLVRGDWRTYSDDLTEVADDAVKNSNTEFVVSTVNIEENSDRLPVNYVLPPGIDRVIDPSNPQLLQLNEQSLSMKVVDLGAKDSRAVYKTANMDFRQYKRLKMEIHAEEISGEPLEDDEVTAFVRLGTDYTSNYYEYEIPLKLTPHGTYSTTSDTHREIVWPEDNRLNVSLDKFSQVKLRRNDEKRMAGSTLSLNDVFSWNDPDNTSNYIRIKGNPNLSNVKTIMLGVRVRGNQSKSVEVWVNELRLTDFDEEGGWAANARMKIDLSDFGSVSMAGKVSTVGFGSIDQSVNERSQENLRQYDVATNLEAGKLLGPESRLSVPVYLGYSNSVASPKYYPLDPDIELDVALANAETDAERDSIKEMSQTVIDHKSINFTNVRLVSKPDAKPSLISPSNISATYSYNESNLRDINTEYEVEKNHKGILAYTYVNRPKVYEPFKNISLFKGKAFSLIRDFNFSIMPTQVGYRWEVIRDYTETQSRNVTDPDYVIPVTVSKDFNWNRYFDMSYNLTKSLKLDFKSGTNARIDEPDGAVNRKRYADEYDLWKDSVLQNIYDMGRITDYTHNTNVTYTIPINKFPLLDWTSANLRYASMYAWNAGSFVETDGNVEYPLGNTIRNSNNIQGSTQLNMTNLYNKVTYLKNINKKYNTTRKQTKKQDAKRTERFNKDGVALEAGVPYTLNHGLKTSDVTVRVFDKNGRPVQGETKVDGTNRITFTPTASQESARFMVVGTIEEKNTPLTMAMDYTALLLTGLKNVSVQYSETNGTIMPGYMPGAAFMGTENSFSAPGVPFILGFQDRDFAVNATQKGWLTSDEAFNSPYKMTHSNDFNIRATFEPIKGLKIDITADRRYSNNLTENYYSGNPVATGTMYQGAFSMSYNIIGTAFDKVDKTGSYESAVYQKFLENRIVIARRMGEQRVGNQDDNGVVYDLQAGSEGANGYNLNSQEVLIPAFLAAYAGKDANGIFLESMPGLSRIQPNWKITYDGLSRLPLFKKVMKSFDVSHAYRSSYSVGSYVSNLEYDSQTDGLSWVRDAQNNFIPEFQVNSVSLSEQFSPFIQFNVTWLNNLTTRAEYKKGRMLNLSLTNNQLIENYTNEWVVGMGYRIDKLALILGNRSFKSDLNLRADVSLRESMAIIRKIKEEVDQLTAGQKVVAVKFTADYALSDRFNLQLFYDTNVTNPYISSSYPMKTSNYGLSFRFTLTQ